jgi:transposase
MPFRSVWLWRLLLLGFVIAYLLSDSLQTWVPPLLPFLVAVAVEAQFFITGLRRGGQPRAAPDRGPQQRDLDELGWASRAITIERDEAVLVLRPGAMEVEEIAEWLQRHREELDALGPGRHELAAIDTPESSVSLYVPPPARRPRRRTRLRLLQALAVLALLAGLFFLDRTGERWQRLPASARQATISLLEKQAARIAGHPAEVICDVGGRHVGYVQDADGLAEIGGRRLWLTPQICYRLYQVRHTGRSAGASSGEAIAVLAHEAWHLHGETSEALANCFGYQSGVQVGEALGLSAASARRLMREQLADNPIDFAATPQYIVASGCQMGGSLDLHLDGPHFP